VQRSADPPAIDLDEADAEVRQRWFVWTAAGLTVHPPTWAGQHDPPDATLRAVRSEVQTPRSLALHVSRPTAHVDIVLHSNGWAEVSVLRPEADTAVHTTVQLHSVAAFGQLLDRVVELITWSGVPKDRDPRQTERAEHWVLGYDGGRWSNKS
jgi:hypothetical protein